MRIPENELKIGSWREADDSSPFTWPSGGQNQQGVKACSGSWQVNSHIFTWVKMLFSLPSEVTLIPCRPDLDLYRCALIAPRKIPLLPWRSSQPDLPIWCLLPPEYYYLSIYTQSIASWYFPNPNSSCNAFEIGNVSMNHVGQYLLFLNLQLDSLL